MRKHVFWKKLILFFKYNNIIRRQNFPHFCFVLFEHGEVYNLPKKWREKHQQQIPTSGKHFE